MSTLRTCTRCGHADLTEACPTCTAEWENRRDAAR
jgi:rRNA maturation protein Nop10